MGRASSRYQANEHLSHGTSIPISQAWGSGVLVQETMVRAGLACGDLPKLVISSLNKVRPGERRELPGKVSRGTRARIPPVQAPFPAW